MKKRLQFLFQNQPELMLMEKNEELKLSKQCTCCKKYYLSSLEHFCDVAVSESKDDAVNNIQGKCIQNISLVKTVQPNDNIREEASNTKHLVSSRMLHLFKPFNT